MWFPNRSDTNRPVQAQKRSDLPSFFREIIPEFSCLKAKRIISVLCTSYSGDVKEICISEIIIIMICISEIIIIMNTPYNAIL